MSPSGATTMLEFTRPSAGHRVLAEAAGGAQIELAREWPGSYLAESLAEGLREAGYRRVGRNDDPIWLCMDLYLLVRDETEFWDLSGCPHRPWLERIESVWLFDRNVVTHLCQARPSYEIHPVETRPFLGTASVDEMDPYARDEIEQWVIEGASRADPGVDYTDAGPVDRQIQADSDWVRHLGTPCCTFADSEDDEARYREVFEEVMEDLRANPRI